MSTKRRVMVERGGGRKLEATFHEFGFEAFEGEGSLCVAIVEWPNGEVETVYVERIRFIDSEVPHEQS